MAWWDRFLARKGAADVERVFRDLYSARETKAGRAVNWKSAIEVSAVLACARVIAEGIAQVPLKLYQASADDTTRLPAKTHPLYKILHRRPNPWQTSYEFRETLALHVVLTGNFYAYKTFVRGQLAELIPLDPATVTVKQERDYGLVYEVQGPDGKENYPAEVIWHVRGPSWNSWMGLEAVYLAREAIGLAMATEETHSTFHKNGAKASGVYSVEGVLTLDQAQKLRDWLVKQYTGDNAHRPMVLDRAAKWQPLSMTGVDAQHLETRRYQVEEICRHFRVMPIMVGYSDKAATYASAEQMFLAHVVHTLAPWYERLEQSIDCNLLSEKDRDSGIYSKFVEEGLLRGALKDTADYLSTLSLNGIMTRNEARSKLDLNPLDGLDDPLTPANMTVGARPEPAPQPDNSQGT